MDAIAVFRRFVDRIDVQFRSDFALQTRDSDGIEFRNVDPFKTLGHTHFQKNQRSRLTECDKFVTFTHETFGEGGSYSSPSGLVVQSEVTAALPILVKLAGAVQ